MHSAWRLALPTFTLGPDKRVKHSKTLLRIATLCNEKCLGSIFPNSHAAHKVKSLSHHSVRAAINNFGRPPLQRRLLSGARSRIRTCGLKLRKLPLYPPELFAQNLKFIVYSIPNALLHSILRRGNSQRVICPTILQKNAVKLSILRTENHKHIDFIPRVVAFLGWFSCTIHRTCVKSHATINDPTRLYLNPVKP